MQARVYRFCTAPPWALSRCILPTYCLLTVFHALMYFSMHALMQLSSPLERDAAGLGMQRSKQYDLDCNAKTACAEQTYLDEHARILHSSFLLDLAHDGRLWVARVRRHAAQGVHVLDCVCGWVSR
jgi:hypothetical protein